MKIFVTIACLISLTVGCSVHGNNTCMHLGVEPNEGKVYQDCSRGLKSPAFTRESNSSLTSPDVGSDQVTTVVSKTLE